MRSLLVSLILICGVIFIISAQSQPPSPAPRKAAQNKNGKAARKNSITSNNETNASDLSSAINNLAAQVASWNKTQSANQNKGDASAGWWLRWSTIATACATLAIAVLGGFQWWAMRRQAEYMRDGLTLTKQAAEAATSSAQTAKDALRISQAADVHIRGVLLLPKGGPLTKDSIMRIRIKNFGLTRAKNFTHNIGIGIRKPIEGKQRSVAITLGPGQTSAIKSPPIGRVVATEDNLNQIINGQIKLRFSGDLRYLDVFGESHVTKCSGTYNPVLGGFDVKQYESDAANQSGPEQYS